MLSGSSQGKIPFYVSTFFVYTGEKKPANTLLFRLPVILVSTAWTNASDDTAVWDMTRNVIDRVKATASSLGILNKFIYMDYGWAGQAEEVFAAYGKENEARLKTIQKSVDPEGVFTRRGLWRGFMKLL